MKDAKLNLLPSDLAAAHAMILEERAAHLEAEAVAARAQAIELECGGADPAHLKLAIEKLRRGLYGPQRSGAHGATVGSRWSFNSKIWRRQRPRTNWRPRMQRPQTQTVKSFQRRAAFAQAVPRSSAA